MSDLFCQNLSYTMVYPSVPFMGMRLWDVGVAWSQLETAPGKYNWYVLDKWIALAKAHGNDLLYTFGWTPQWASGQSSIGAPPSDVLSGDAQWKAFVTALVKHSLASGYPIKFYEIWNEPDLKSTWQGTATQLVQMGKDAYQIIHGLDPKAKVVGPSPSTANQWGVHYLPDYYAAGGAPYQDIVSCHAYLYDSTGTQFASTPDGIVAAIKSLKVLMAKYNLSTKPIWFTEGSWGRQTLAQLTMPQRVAYLTKEYQLMAANGVQRYYWYSWDNPNWGTLYDAKTGINAAGQAYGMLSVS